MDDSFFRCNSNSVGNPVPRWGRLCPRAKSEGFCGARIQAECLKIDADGNVRVGLAARPKEWFGMLAHLGDVLHFVRNDAVALTIFGPIPPMENWHNPIFPRDQNFLFAPNLAEYSSLCATRGNSLVRAIYGFESRDVSGFVFEKILMPSLSNRDLFEEFVITHQSSVESGGNWFPANHAYSKRFRVRRAARIPWLNSRWAKGAKDLVRVSVEFPNRLLAEVTQQRIPIRVLHYSNALIRTAVWSPKPNSETNIAENGLSSFQDESMGLNLDIKAIGSVWLWASRCAGCGNHRWTVEIGDRQGRVCLSITVGAESLEDDWRRLIVACLS